MKSRLAAGEQTPDWESAQGFDRRESLLRALRRNFQLNPGPSCIVETGTLRDDRDIARRGDGWATLAWGWYAAQVGGRAVTVDNDPDAIAVCKRMTAPLAAAIDYIVSDSIAFLSGWQSEKRGPIHLLYLDSVDYIDRERSEEHHLAEAQAALPLLAPKCLVLSQSEKVLVDSSYKARPKNPFDFLVAPVVNAPNSRPYTVENIDSEEW